MVGFIQKGLTKQIMCDIVRELTLPFYFGGFVTDEQLKDLIDIILERVYETPNNEESIWYKFIDTGKYPNIEGVLIHRMQSGYFFSKDYLGITFQIS